MSRCQVWWCRRPATTSIAMSPTVFRSMAVCQLCADRMSGAGAGRAASADPPLFSRHWWVIQVVGFTLVVGVGLAVWSTPGPVLVLLAVGSAVGALALMLLVRRLDALGARLNAQVGYSRTFILRALAAEGPLTGWDARQAVRRISGVELPLTSVYSSLRRLMDDGLVEFVGLEEGEEGQRARNLYGLTDEGQASAVLAFETGREASPR